MLYYLDDDPDDRMLFDDVMRELGHSPKLFDSARALLESLEMHLPQRLILFTDLNMPRMDGFELLALLRADARLRNVPIVVISTDGSPQTMERCRTLGASAYLKKADCITLMRHQLSRILSFDWSSWKRRSPFLFPS